MQIKQFLTVSPNFAPSSSTSSQLHVVENKFEYTSNPVRKDLKPHFRSSTRYSFPQNTIQSHNRFPKSIPPHQGGQIHDRKNKPRTKPRKVTTSPNNPSSSRGPPHTLRTDAPMPRENKQQQQHPKKRRPPPPPPRLSGILAKRRPQGAREEPLLAHTYCPCAHGATIIFSPEACTLCT